MQEFIAKIYNNIHYLLCKTDDKYTIYYSQEDKVIHLRHMTLENINSGDDNFSDGKYSDLIQFAENEREKERMSNERRRLSKNQNDLENKTGKKPFKKRNGEKYKHSFE